MDTKSTNPATALEHVLSDVLREQPQVPAVLNGPYRKAFAMVGIQDINDLLAIEPMVDFKDIIIKEVLPPTPIKGTGLGPTSPVPGSGTVPASMRER